MIGNIINSLRASKAIWDVTFSDDSKSTEQREVLKSEFNQGVQAIKDGYNDKTVVEPKRMAKPFRVALWILIIYAMWTIFTGGHG